MSKNKSIKKNFIMNAILSMSGFIFPLITFPYISRVLGPSGIGSIRFVSSVIAYFAMFAQLGIPTYGIRACAKIRDDKEKLSKTVHELLLINLITNIISYVVLFASLLFVTRFHKDRMLFIIMSSTLFFNMIGVEYLYKALEEYTYITFRSLIFKVIAIILMFVFVNSQEDYVIYGAITIFAALASNVLNFFNSRKYISYKWQGNYEIKKHLSPVFVFFAMTCAASIYLNLDGIMLGFMTTDTELGYYDAAVKIKVLLISVVSSLGAVILPRASYYVETGEMEKFHEITQKAIRFVLFIATPIMVYFIAFSKESILFISGEKYMASIPAMKVIMPTVLLIGLSNIIGMQILVPLGKEKIVLYSEIVGAVIDLVLNAALIPILKSTGAAIGTTVAELFVLIVQVIYIKNKENVLDLKQLLFDSKYWKNVIGCLLAFGASFGVNLIVKQQIHLGVTKNSFMLLVISACLFFGLYAATMLLLRDDFTKELFLTLLRRKKKLSA